MIVKKTLGALLIAAALAAVPLSARADGPKVVLELFTSQGCSSCPSADNYLGELAAERDDVVALSFHVDYWDYIGWEDRFATKESTQRQRDYARALGVAYVYTPQLVIDGARHEVGSHKRAVNDAIAVSKASKTRRAPVALTSSAPDRLTVEIGHSDGYYGDATIWLVSVDRQHTTTVDAGENRGRELVNYNVVRNFRPIGRWVGNPMTLELGPDELSRGGQGMGDGCAVLVQENHGKGRIMGADLVWLQES
ncbi:MAG: DUF1223 domain-containing protein [Rhodospirillales bacterium]|nr:DUF1223 domain-containing protein [Rhodospirillales bacterium]